MRRKILWTVIVVLATWLTLVFGQYGIRLKDKPCTHLTAIGIVANYITKDCQRFTWTFAVP